MPGQFKYIGFSRVEIHDEVLFAPSGSIGRWAKKVAAKNTIETKKAAPVNKRTNKFPGNFPRGYLRSQISSSVDREGPKIIGIATESRAPYTIYVIQGTGTQYFRDAAGRFAKGGFPLPANNFGDFRRARIIRGQAANNFLVKGLAGTARTHPSLGGVGFKRFNT
jgi:hypothetical protein